MNQSEEDKRDGPETCEPEAGRGPQVTLREWCFALISIIRFMISWMFSNTRFITKKK